MEATRQDRTVTLYYRRERVIAHQGDPLKVRDYNTLYIPETLIGLGQTRGQKYVCNSWTTSVHVKDSESKE